MKDTYLFIRIYQKSVMLTKYDVLSLVMVKNKSCPKVVLWFFVPSLWRSSSLNFILNSLIETVPNIPLSFEALMNNHLNSLNGFSFEDICEPININLQSMK